MEEISTQDKKNIKKILKSGFEKFKNDPDYPMPDLAYKMLKIWLNDIDKYLYVVSNYLAKNSEATISDAAIDGVFPYIMAFQNFFQEHYIEEQVTEK
jgi:hypothetical protein